MIKTVKLVGNDRASVSACARVCMRLHVCVRVCVRACSIVMNHLSEQSDTQNKKIRSNMCESTSVPKGPAGSVPFNQDIVIPWTQFNWPTSHGVKLRSNYPNRHSVHIRSHTHQFTGISPGSWRACRSSWASEPLWRTHLQPQQTVGLQFDACLTLILQRLDEISLSSLGSDLLFFIIVSFHVI